MFADSQPFTQKTIAEIIVLDEEDTPSNSCFTKHDLCDALVDVCGILLPKRVTEKIPAQSRYEYSTITFVY